MTRHPHMSIDVGWNTKEVGTSLGNNMGGGFGYGHTDGSHLGFGNGVGSGCGDGSGFVSGKRVCGYCKTTRWLDNLDPRYTVGWFTMEGTAKIYKTVP